MPRPGDSVCAAERHRRNAAGTRRPRTRRHGVLWPGCRRSACMRGCRMSCALSFPVGSGAKDGEGDCHVVELEAALPPDGAAGRRVCIICASEVFPDLSGHGFSPRARLGSKHPCSLRRCLVHDCKGPLVTDRTMTAHCAVIIRTFGFRINTLWERGGTLRNRRRRYHFLCARNARRQHECPRSTDRGHSWIGAGGEGAGRKRRRERRRKPYGAETGEGVPELRCTRCRAPARGVRGRGPPAS